MAEHCWVPTGLGSTFTRPGNRGRPGQLTTAACPPGNSHRQPNRRSFRRFTPRRQSCGFQAAGGWSGLMVVWRRRTSALCRTPTCPIWANGHRQRSSRPLPYLADLPPRPSVPVLLRLFAGQRQGGLRRIRGGAARAIESQRSRLRRPLPCTALTSGNVLVGERRGHVLDTGWLAPNGWRAAPVSVSVP